jgi:hypothetical protein
LFPRLDGAILSKEWKEALWDKVVTAAPRPRRPPELQYSDRKPKTCPPSGRGRAELDPELGINPGTVAK